MLVPSLCIFQTMPVQTLPSAILQEKLRKAKKSRSRSASSASLLENSDGLDYRSTGEHRDGLLTGSENLSVEATPPPPLRALLLMPRVSIAVINSSVFFFCDMNRHVLTPLMWSTSLEHGGLGFTPYAIGLAMGIFGAANMCVQAAFLGKIIRYFGARKVFTASLVAYLVSILCFPLEKYFAQRAGGADWRVWTVIAVQLAMYCLITPAYGESIMFALARPYSISIFFLASIQVLITDSAPSQSALGSVNGLAQAVASVSRALAPSFASSLFAISLQRNWAGGDAGYYILMGLVACAIRLSLLLPDKLHLQ